MSLKSSKKRRLGRLACSLVTTALVTWIHPCPGVAGSPAAIATAAPDVSVTEQVVRGNARFAVQLYRQLAAENERSNLFFSPYSVSSALAMTAEGARGQTLDEMARVLHFPEAARRGGEDAQHVPWETALVHKGMASITERLVREEDERQTAAIRSRIAQLRQQHEAAEARARDPAKPSQERFRARGEAKALAAELNAALAQVDQYEIRVANALWGEQTYPFREEFIDTVNRYYQTGGVFAVDFRRRWKAARVRINAWVEHETNERIKDLIPRGALNEDSRLVLTNAIYFKGEWAEPFEADATEDRDFTLASGETIQTRIMHAPDLESSRYAAFNGDGSRFHTPRAIAPGQTQGLYPGADGFAVIEMPYKGGELAMVVLAPNKPDGLAALEAKLTGENLARWIGELQDRQVHVFLPKFKLETDYTLGDAENPGPLQAMGIVRAFTPPAGNESNGADFTGMSSSTDPSTRLYISLVLHKAFVEVSEEGTEAAAATAVIMARFTSVPATVPFTPTFHADRPFLFLIRDRGTGCILFLARVTHPKT